MTAAGMDSGRGKRAKVRLAGTRRFRGERLLSPSAEKTKPEAAADEVWLGYPHTVARQRPNLTALPARFKRPFVNDRPGLSNDLCLGDPGRNLFY
ncbi:hypothetical protein L21SP4_01107 [Kiritimatiella glycovorans]|uniref:Uncharacterized protein n=1 Tax=Kiritimatiella glycovorans TaxID=1307763 RepID=A0A0G3EJQ8_9BACT|nr:hypothetical protein L21SP4_01107 [Kiritimatiella glycovorans]